MYLFLRKFTLLHFLFICLQLLHVTHAQNHTELICTQMLNIQLLNKCCGDSNPSNLLYTHRNCGQFKSDEDACRYECIFKQWQLLSEDNTLIMSNVSSMISSLYTRENGFKSYGKVLLDSFHHCHNFGSSYKGLVRIFVAMASPDNINNATGSRCNNKAFLYAKCTAANVFLNCPAFYWQESIEDCEASKRLLGHCVNFFSGVENVNERGGLKSNSASKSFKLQMQGRQPTHWYTAFFNWLVF